MARPGVTLKFEGESALLGCLFYLGVMGAYLCGVTSATMLTVFWLFGVWIPWFVAIFGGFLGPVLAPTFLILWALHFVPQVIFPIFHG